MEAGTETPCSLLPVMNDGMTRASGKKEWVV